MIKINNKEMCCGCTACANICSQNAIEMVEDFEGFLYPKINEEKCINCGLCNKVCPYLKVKKSKKDFLKAYTVQNKNDNILKTSTSGGFLTPLFEFVLEHNGYVSGVVLNNDFLAEHIIYGKENKDKIYKFRGSKYVQSNLKKVFKEIKILLDQKKLVCFCGSPCQVEGLKNYLIKEYENLITVDFVCRSVPSSLFLKKYLEYQEKKYKSKIKNLYFRSKTYGYHSGTLTLEFVNGKKYTGSNRVDYYSKCFHADVCSRPSCYNCIAKGMNRMSDFTVFDSWKPDNLIEKFKDNDKGYTNLFVHSKKAYDLFEKELKKNFYYFEINPNEANKYTGGMIERSIKFKEERKKFYSDLNNLEFDETINKYVKISFWDKLFEKSKVFLFKIGLLKVIKNLRGRRKEKR